MSPARLAREVSTATAALVAGELADRGFLRRRLSRAKRRELLALLQARFRGCLVAYRDQQRAGRTRESPTTP